jgi:hypothetical protein
MKPNCLLQAAVLVAFQAHQAVCAREFHDAPLTMPAWKENVLLGLGTDAYEAGRAAYSWGSPLVRRARVASEYTDVPRLKPATGYRTPLNQIGESPVLATPEVEDIEMPNPTHFECPTSHQGDCCEHQVHQIAPNVSWLFDRYQPGVYQIGDV